MSHQKTIFIVLALLLLLLLASCQEAEPVEVTRIVNVEVPGPPVEVTRIVEVQVPAEAPAVEEPTETTAVALINVPFQAQWAASPHANAESTAFRYWDTADPAEIPTRCAKCHSTTGYLDFLGADGSAAGVVDAPAPLGTVVSCEACHNDVTVDKTSVLFPSGIEIMNLGAEARCMECHQGRSSKLTVDASIENAGLTPEDLDVVSADLGFTNIHYYAAAATQYGKLAMGGYEYNGKSYDARFEHVAPYETCTDCHDSHTLELKLGECSTCHEGLNTQDDLLNVRSLGSLVDYDGDGNISEGIYYEIEGMRAPLFAAIQAYAKQVGELPILYTSARHPYFFGDPNENNTLDEGEVAYNAWTPRLAKAAYNYQVSLKDPGRYAHGGKYIIQLLYDSLEDLNQVLDEPIDMSKMRRIDHGHFAGSETAFRYWDSTGIVPTDCAKCHTAAGLPFFLTNNVNIAQPSSNGLNCASCHDNVTTFSRYIVEQVTFPSGARLTTGDLDSNMCLNCHQGRESTVSVNRLIGDLGPDDTSGSLRFLNIHYFSAASTVFGTEAKGVYEYSGKTYFGRYVHVERFDTCTECHDSHALEVEVNACGICHEGVSTATDLRNIRFNEEGVYVDWDGDGDIEEGISGEIATLTEKLYVALQAYAAATEGVDNIIYDKSSFPYFFIDTNADGVGTPDEVNFGNRYVTWTPRLLRAAYNYQYALKDPGAYAHNPPYIIQVLYDSLEDIGADMTGLSRPVTPTE